MKLSSIKTTLAASALIGLLAGCDAGSTPEEKRHRGEVRHQIFVECMELAAKMERQSDDDVHKVVGKCSNEAYYMANGITAR